MWHPKRTVERGSILTICNAPAIMAAGKRNHVRNLRISCLPESWLVTCKARASPQIVCIPGLSLLVSAITIAGFGVTALPSLSGYREFQWNAALKPQFTSRPPPMLAARPANISTNAGNGRQILQRLTTGQQRGYGR